MKQLSNQLKKSISKDKTFDTNTLLNNSLPFLPNIKATYICEILNIKFKESRDNKNLIITELMVKSFEPHDVTDQNLVKAGDKFAHMISLDPNGKYTIQMVVKALTGLFLAALGIGFINKKQWEEETSSVVNAWLDDVQRTELLTTMVSNEDEDTQSQVIGNIVMLKSKPLITSKGAEFTAVEYFAYTESDNG